MQELYNILFSMVNTPLTIIMIGMIVYWIFALIGAFDINAFDVEADLGIDTDLDIDIDVDTDLDVDTDFEIESDFGGVEDVAGFRGKDLEGKRRRKLSTFKMLLVFFHFVEVPFMMAFTMFVFIWWSLTIYLTQFFHLYDNIMGFVVLAATFIPGLFLLKFFSYPLKMLFKKFNPKGVENLEIEGRIAKATTLITDKRLGQVELVIDESPIKLNVMCIHKNQEIKEGTEVLIIKKSKDLKYYLIDVNQ